MQRSFAEYDGFRKQRKITRREAFLAEMERVVPWRRLESLIEPHYPLAGKGRKPYRLSTTLRIHLLQHWYGYSDPGMEEALHDIPALRRFAGLDAGESRMPDETTILNFRHLLEAQQLAESLFQEVVSLLTKQGLILREGTLVDATLIAALRLDEERSSPTRPGDDVEQEGQPMAFWDEGAYRRRYGAWPGAYAGGHDRQGVRLQHGGDITARRRTNRARRSRLRRQNARARPCARRGRGWPALVCALQAREGVRHDA